MGDQVVLALPIQLCKVHGCKVITTVGNKKTTLLQETRSRPCY